MTDGKSERSYYLRCGVMSMEGRTSGRNQLSRRNVMSTTETQDITETKLRKIALISSNNPQKQFHSLMHHYNLASLKKCFKELGRNKSPGIDGMKEDYEKNVDAKLQSLLTRMKSMSYRPAPVRQVFIPKEGSRIEKRPLGINNLEDKIFMKMTQKILESIYEPLFLNCSYGFRPGRGCHDAIKDLREHLFKAKVQVVIDVDIKNFFGTIDHKTLVEMIREKIKDTRFIRYLVRTLRSGSPNRGRSNSKRRRGCARVTLQPRSR